MKGGEIVVILIVGCLVLSFIVLFAGAIYMLIRMRKPEGLFGTPIEESLAELACRDRVVLRVHRLAPGSDGSHIGLEVIDRWGLNRVSIITTFDVARARELSTHLESSARTDRA